MKKTILKLAFGCAALGISALSATAGDIEVLDKNQRLDYIRKAIVWQRPAWINDAGDFARSFDVAAGSPSRGNSQLLEADDVYCQATAEDVSAEAYEGTGRTPKLYCQLMRQASNGSFELVVKPSGKREKIKVKYDGLASRGANTEIHGELIGTRLLWALGFGADRMYYVPRVHCFGCSADPFESRTTDPSTLQNARVFSPGAIEVKLNADEIVYAGPQPSQHRGHRDNTPPRPLIPTSGWSMEELVRELSADSAVRAQQAVERQALQLLIVFMHHIDNKAANHRTVCLDGADANGNCSGRVLLFIQDIGSSFGVSLKGLRLDKVNFETWKNQPVWSAPSRCNASTGMLLEGAPRITEAGRQFLAKLLDGFSKGAEGRARVEALFRESGVERLGHSVAEWSDVFIDKVQQIKYPMGAGQPNFRCPN